MSWKKGVIVFASALVAGAGSVVAFDEGWAMVRQPDHKVIVAGIGASRDFALARYRPGFGLDRSFGGDGKVVTDFDGGYDTARGVVLQPDGKILAAGFTNGDFALARYHIDGHLDFSFDGDGRVTCDFAGNRDEGRAVALQADGKILVAGAANLRTGDSDFALVRFLSDGGLDPGFGVNGKVVTDFAGGNDEGCCVDLLADGKILVAGFAWGGASGEDFAIARYLPDGTLDGTFGTGGVVTNDFDGGFDRINDLVIQPDGKLLVGGENVKFAGIRWTRIALARYGPDGALDPGFEPGARPNDFFEKSATSVLLLSDGSIVVVAAAWDVPFFRRTDLVRFSAAGVEEESDYAARGVPSGGGLLLPGGDILLAGTTSPSFSANSDFFLARYMPDRGGPAPGITRDFDRYQPDSLIALKRSRKIGNDVYNRTGTGQRIRITGRSGETSKFFAFFQNDGTTTDTLRVRGTGDGRHVKVRYFQLNADRLQPKAGERRAKLPPPPPRDFPARRNVTAAVTTRKLALFGQFDLHGEPRLEVQVRSRKGRSAIRTFRIKSTSNGDRTKVDAVTATYISRR